MLARLDTVDGVKAAMTNRSGNLLRIVLHDKTKAGHVAANVARIFQQQKRKAKRVTGSELVSALNNHEWRTSNTVGELSEIEFRTIFARRVKEFTEEGGVDVETADRLLEIAQEVLADTPKPEPDTSWREFCRDLIAGMMAKAESVLTSEQLDVLATKLQSRIEG